MDKKKVTNTTTSRSEAHLACLVGILRSRPDVSSQIGTLMVSHDSRVGDSLMESVSINGKQTSKSAFRYEFYRVKKPSSGMSNMFSVSLWSMLLRRHCL